jgi:hypothetical protein
MQIYPRIGPKSRNSMATREPSFMHTTNTTNVGDSLDFELALLRRSLGGFQAERCHGCQRAMLIGERVYEYESGAVRCELCRERAHADAIESHMVHGPAFGHSIRIIDRRAA